MSYFRTVMYVLKHHSDTLKLKNANGFKTGEFVGMNIVAGGTQPTYTKNEAFYKIERTNTWGDLCMFIGIFIFYNQFLPLYYMDIRPWRYIFVKKTPTSKTTPKGGYGTGA